MIGNFYKSAKETFQGVPIVELAMTDKQVFSQLRKKGIKRKKYAKRPGDFSFATRDFLVYYNDFNWQLELYYRDNTSVEIRWVGFAVFSYGLRALSVWDVRAYKIFEQWLKETSKATLT